MSDQYCITHPQFVQSGDLCDGFGRPVATLRADGVIVKRVHSSRHQLRKPPAWCVDEALLSEGERRGAWGLLLIDLDANRRPYFASVLSIRRFGFSLRRGYGDQIAMRIERWLDHVERPQDEKPAPAPQEPQQAECVQLSFFGGVA